jgi:large subunit ribosomal protein LP1
MSTQELAVSYAALILTDQSLEITADKLTAIAKAAGVTLEPIWAQVCLLLGRRFSGCVLTKLATDLREGAQGPQAGRPPGFVRVWRWRRRRWWRRRCPSCRCCRARCW